LDDNADNVVDNTMDNDDANMMNAKAMDTTSTTRETGGR
jgi:hypothetical protein